MNIVSRIAVLLLVSALPASAQVLKIHGHPQKTEYASPAEWPIIEAQGWWPDHDPIAACHLHLGPQFPSYMELTTLDPFRIHFTLKLHNCAGNITQVYGSGFKDVMWDETGSSQMPVMRGMNPGLVQWTGTTSIQFRLHGDQPWLGTLNDMPVHGWIGIDWYARLILDNGDQLDVQKVDCLYSLLDPSKPEQPASGQGRPGIVHSSRVTVLNRTVDLTLPGRTLGGTSFGAMVMEVNDYLPLLPIDKPWATIVNPYNYTAASALPNGRFLQMLDANLHGMPPPPNRGTTLVDDGAGVQGFVNRTITFDPAVMGAGPHKVLTVWRQEANNETVHAVLSISVPVGPGVPPALCTDTTALNVGHPIPCVYPPPPPPPPPPPTWITDPLVFVQRLGTRIRTCLVAAPTTCTELVVK